MVHHCVSSGRPDFIVLVIVHSYSAIVIVMLLFVAVATCGWWLLYMCKVKGTTAVVVVARPKIGSLSGMKEVS